MEDFLLLMNTFFYPVVQEMEPWILMLMVLVT